MHRRRHHENGGGPRDRPPLRGGRELVGSLPAPVDPVLEEERSVDLEEQRHAERFGGHGARGSVDRAALVDDVRRRIPKAAAERLGEIAVVEDAAKLVRKRAGHAERGRERVHGARRRIGERARR